MKVSLSLGAVFWLTLAGSTTSAGVGTASQGLPSAPDELCVQSLSDAPPRCLGQAASTPRKLNLPVLTTAEPEEVDDPEAPTGGPPAKLGLWVSTDWKMWTGVDDAKNFLKGTLGLTVLWDERAEEYVASPRSVINVDNFASGSSGIVYYTSLAMKQGNVSFKVATNHYVGDFKQSYSTECYPFDIQEFKVIIDIPYPGSLVFDFNLQCQDADLAYDEYGNEVERISGVSQTNIKKCYRSLDNYGSSGFYWQDWSCILGTETTITCTMKAVRNYQKLLMSFLIPGLCVIEMGFLSCKLLPGMSMPRVATTMISMLTLSNKFTGLSSKLPGTGEYSWLEVFFMSGMILMWLILSGHVLAFWLDSIGHPLMRKFIDELSFYILQSSFAIFMCSVLVQRNCIEQQVDSFSLYFAMTVAVMINLGSAIQFVEYIQPFKDFFSENLMSLTEPEEKKVGAGTPPDDDSQPLQEGRRDTE